MAVVTWLAHAQALQVAVFALTANASSVLVQPTPLYILFRILLNFVWCLPYETSEHLPRRCSMSVALCLHVLHTAVHRLRQGCPLYVQIYMVLVCTRVTWATSKAIEPIVIEAFGDIWHAVLCSTHWMISYHIKVMFFGTNSISLVWIGLKHFNRDQFNSHRN